MKTRNWLGIAYPESSTVDIPSFFEEEQLCAALSPLHDSDTKPDGSLKKPHYHFILHFDGPKSYENVLSLCSPLAINTVKVCNSLTASIAYLSHLNSPDKYQYDPSLVRTFGGFPVDSNSTVLPALLNLIRDNNIVNLCDLINIILDNPDYSSYLTVLSSNAYLVNSYLHTLSSQS